MYGHILGQGWYGDVHSLDSYSLLTVASWEAVLRSWSYIGLA